MLLYAFESFPEHRVLALVLTWSSSLQLAAGKLQPEHPVCSPFLASLTVQTVPPRPSPLAMLGWTPIGATAPLDSVFDSVGAACVLKLSRPRNSPQ